MVSHSVNSLDCHCDYSQQDALSSLDSQPRPRERAAAFSTKSDKTVSGKLLQRQRNTQTKEVYTYTADPAQACIQNSTPCWYCGNLITLKICAICGN